eukprot:CAMPEP_0170453998 /NCGR_PEP_ID=MMETSP0123-20130129/2399_1 /TAXON_ID=182087 /ORGANISM="Favella ehrenbergii, Strain Fehren 1" /LENGTH=31 /DNA_ID= /DNA_START= /DNA_END= /DNA_ORIENTATION=
MAAGQQKEHEFMGDYALAAHSRHDARMPTRH